MIRHDDVCRLFRRLDVDRNRGEREGASTKVKAREVRLVRVVERARNHRAQRAAYTQKRADEARGPGQRVRVPDLGDVNH